MKKTVSLKRNDDFQHVFRKGKTKGSSILVVFVMPNDMCFNRLGVTVSKKMGKAVLRNKLRRRIKEAFRLFEQDLVAGHDIVILPKPDLAQAKFNNILKTLKFLLKKQGLLDG